MSSICRNTGNDLYLEVEAGEPVYAERSPIRIGWLAENLLLYRHDSSELVLRVSVEGGYVHNIIHRAVRGAQRGLQVVKGQPYLAFEIGLRCSIGTAANLSGYKQQVTGSDSGGIAVILVKSVPVGRKDCSALGHF